MKNVYDFLLKSQWFWAFLFLPIINISALFLAHPLQENITHIAYAKQHFFFVLIWAISCAFYCYGYTKLCMKQWHYEKKSGRLALMLSCLMMVVSVCIPYQEDQTQLSSKLHVDLAMIATVTYILVFLSLLYHGYFHEPLLCMKILPWYLMIIGTLSLLFLLMGCVSTLIETLFVLGMAWLHYHMQRLIKAQASVL